MILFYARKRYATCSSDDRLTTGSVGVEVVFHFSDDWAAAPSRIAVFRGSGVSVDVALLEDSCTVPPEVLTQPGSTLTIGVYGTDAEGTVVIPTVYAEAGQIRRGAEPSGVEPTPQTQPLIDQLLAAAQAARDAADEAERLAQSVRDDADAGEFDGSPGADGSGVWYTTGRISGGENPFVRRRDLIGREGATVQVHDLLFAPDVGDEGEPTTLYEITSVGTACTLNRLCKMQGEDGTSPSVTITEITGGHRITITDEAHPHGQSFDVMDGQGGSGSSDYNDLSNKPQIAGVTLSGNKSLADLGIAAASDIPTVPVQSVNGKTGAVVLNASDVGAGTYSKPSGGIPASDLASAVQTSLGKADTAYQKPSGGIPDTDLSSAVRTSLGKANTALQSAPVTSVNGQTGAVSLPIPSTASDVGAVASNQGVANANKMLTVNSSGVVVPEDDRFVVTLTPTSPDYSGTMDKTPAELAAAYEADKRIVAYAPAFNFRCELSLTTIKSGGLYTFDFIALGELNGQDIMLRLLTSDSTSTYTVKIYPLATGQWTGGSF